MSETKQRNQTIDFLRIIFAVMIIGIHLSVFRDTNPFLYRILRQGLFRIGVPFYFITSGYYLAGRLNESGKVKVYIFRLIRTFLIFEIIDIFVSFPFVAHEMLWLTILRILTTGLNGIYWYLVSLILTTALFSSLWKNDHTLFCMILGLLLYLFVMTSDSYSAFFQNMPFLNQLHGIRLFIWHWPQAGLASSLLFMSMGVWIAQKKIRVPHAGWLALIMTLVLMAEANFVQAMMPLDGNCYFSLLFAAPLVFLAALEHPRFPLYFSDMRDIAMHMYLVHYIPNFIVQFDGLQDTDMILSSAVSFVTALLIIWVNRLITAHKKRKELVSTTHPLK